MRKQRFSSRRDEDYSSLATDASARPLNDGRPLCQVFLKGLGPSGSSIVWRCHGWRPFFFALVETRNLTEANMLMLDQLEDQGLLGSHQQTIHCTGAYTDELPAPGYNPAHPRARDLWTCGMSQIFSTVSPAMHEEFELAYAREWYERFGLVYYGCCEPLDRKLDIVKKIPNVRKISMSPWVDVEAGASQIGREYVFSRKPSPAFLAGDDWNPKAVEADLRKTLEACARHGCPVELILKDISTVRYQPQRLWEWSDIAMRLVRDAQ